MSKKFLLKYSLLWIFSGFAMLLIIVFPELLELTAGFLGVKVASNGLFAMCILFIVMILMYLTVTVTDLTFKIKRLVQMIAVMEKKLRDAEDSKNEDCVEKS